MTGPVSARRPRADAQRNRERIIEAAIDAFREGGLDVSVAEIARRAGVGSGTLFRNFPTKNDLVHAIVELRMEQWQKTIESSLEAGDARAGFDAFFAAAVAWNYHDRGMLEAFKGGIMDDPDLHDCKCAAMDRTGVLVARVKQAGMLREEISTEDVYALAAGAAESAKMSVQETGARPDDALARYVEIVLAGLRP